jgi:hypothetical protein
LSEVAAYSLIVTGCAGMGTDSHTYATRLSALPYTYASADGDTDSYANCCSYGYADINSEDAAAAQGCNLTRQLPRRNLCD